jgi:hypothetical protein
MDLAGIVTELSTLGIAHAVLSSGEEGAILVLPDYGRVLGLWPHWRAENALWVNPDFLRCLHIGSKDDGWMNPGGDRLVLAPEAEFLAEGPGSAPELDPGRYEGAGDKTLFTMENRGEARAWKAGARVRFRIVRRIRPLDPAGLRAAWGDTYLRAVGFEEEAYLEIAGGVPVSLWSATQVRPDAELHALPVAGGDSVLLAVEEQESGRAQLIARRFNGTGPRDPAVPPSACRADAPDGSAEIACSSSTLSGGGKQRLTWRTSLCAFSGRREEILAFRSRIATGR